MRDEPIIDMHQHAQNMWYEEDGRPALNIVTGEPSTADSSEMAIQSTLGEMDRHNIVKSVIFGELDVVYRWMDEASDRFISSPTIWVDSPSMCGLGSTGGSSRGGVLPVCGL